MDAHRAPVTVDETDACRFSLFGPAARNKSKREQNSPETVSADCIPLFPFELITAECESTDRGRRRRPHHGALLSHISLLLAARSHLGSACVITASSALTSLICVKLPPMEGWQALWLQVAPTLPKTRTTDFGVVSSSGSKKRDGFHVFI